MINLQRIKNIRKYLTVEASAKLVLSLCFSHLDYSNSILAGLLDSTIKQMQRILNYEAKQALAEFHWLPLESRIKFKILTIVYKCLRGVAPDYFRNLLVRCPLTTHTLRSNDIIDRPIIP